MVMNYLKLMNPHL